MNKGFSWRRWLNRCRASLFGKAAQRRPILRSRLQVEILESRSVPTIALSTVQFAFANESLLKSAGMFTIPVTLSTTSTTATSVPFTLGGNADGASDFSGVTASPLVIPPGQLAGNITGTLIDGITPDATKTLTLILGTPIGATLGSTTVNTLTIAEPAANPTTLSIANSSAIEPAGSGTANMVFTVTRTGDLTSQITVGFTTVAGTAQPTTDFTPTTGTTTFVAGSATATISIPIFGNGVFNNPSLTFSVQLTGIVKGVGPPATLAAQATFATGTAPVSVAVGDLNGDGKPDLVVANSIDNTVAVLLNTTTPGASSLSFATQETFATGAGPISVALGDVNGDGKPDLVVANKYDNTVSVLRNTTTPGASMASFATQQTFATGAGPFSVALGDVNGDGKPDLLVTNTGGTVSVLLNTATPGASTASFATQQTFAAGNNPISVALGDVNGDGKPDLLVANLLDNTVSVLLNTTPPGASTASFATQQAFATGTTPSSVALADVNGDGKPDLLVANYTSNTVSVLLNTTTPGATTPSFATQQTFATGPGPCSIALADVNGDGTPDVLVANYKSNTVSVLLNTTPPGASTASFATQQTFATGAGPFSVALGDVNGDGWPDVLVANNSAGTVSVLLNTPVTIPGNLATGTITESGAPLTVQFSAATESVSETAGTFSITVTLSAASTLAVIVPFTLSGIGYYALPGIDYSGVTASPLVIAAGSTSGAITGTLLDDHLFDTYNRTLILTLGTPTNATLGATTTNTLTIIQENHTPPTVQFSAASESVSATAGTFSIAVTLSAMSRQGTIIGFTLGGTAVAGTDYSGVTVSQLEIGPGSTSGTITGTLIDDGSPNFVKTLTFTLVGATPAVLGSTTVNTLNITESAIVQFSAATESISENAGTFSIPVTLSAASTSSVSVPFTLGGTAVAGTDYSGVKVSPLVIPAGSTSGTITGTVLDDNLFDPANRTLTVTLGTPTNAALGTFTTNTMTITQDSDAPPVVQFSAATESFNETGGTFSVTVTLSAISEVATTIPFTLPTALPFTSSGTAVAGMDYSGVTASPLVIAAGHTSGTITGTLLDDNLFDTANRTLTLTLGTPTNATLGTLTTNTLTIIGESVTAPTVQFSAATESVSDTAGTFSVTVALSAASEMVTSIPFTLGGTAVNGRDYSGVGVSLLVIPAGSTSGTITGTLIDDGSPHAVKVLTFTLGTPTNATLGATTTNTLTITEAVSTRPSFPGETPQERYIQAEYLNELGRVGSVAELDGWVAVLIGPGGAKAVVGGIMNSAEGRGNLVKSWYKTFLGRSAENGEVQSWVNQLVQGQSEESVLSQILGSAEFYARAQTLVSTGTADQRYVQALYNVLLQRYGGSGEIAGWVVNPLSQLGRQGLAKAILQSIEYRTIIITAFYTDLLHRQPDPTGLAGWVNSSLDISTVRANFEATTEFMNNG